MQYAGRLVADGAVDIVSKAGASPFIDAIAAADVPEHAFLRAAWFEAAAAGGTLQTLLARRADGEAIAAIPLVERRRGPLRLREVAGAYWPYRSFPIAAGASEPELAAFLASTEARAALGRAWRLGPVLADDPTALRLRAAAEASDWTVLTRGLGTCYRVDLKALAGSGPWPSSKTLRKNRWLERRLAESGELAFSTVSGEQWDDSTLDILAAIEAESWVARQADARDTKFLNPATRAMWAKALEDPVLAAALACSILHVGGVPAAFAFTLRTGPTLSFIANSYSERFREGSPGRILLYRDFQRALADGVETIGWGAGDPGYKSEMGATPGPEIVDLLIVRGPLAAPARPFWRSRA